MTDEEKLELLEQVEDDRWMAIRIGVDVATQDAHLEAIDRCQRIRAGIRAEQMEPELDYFQPDSILQAHIAQTDWNPHFPEAWDPQP